MKNSGDSEAPVESGGADRNAGVDGSDQDHLEDHQDQGQCAKQSGRDSKDCIETKSKTAGTNQGRKEYICQSCWKGWTDLN